MTEGRSTDMNLYHLLCKVENGLGSDTVLREPQELTPVEIECSVVEAGSGMGGDIRTLLREPSNSGAEEAHTHMGSSLFYPPVIFVNRLLLLVDFM
jgi:hypothetical protein